MEIRVHLLGRFELTCDGTVVIDRAWKPAKAAAMVKILALRPGRTMHRDQLIAALWPDADAEAGQSSLYKNVHGLRKAIRKAGGPRDVIRLVHPAVSLAPYVRTDIDEISDHVSALGPEPPKEALAAVLALFRGPLLPDDLYEPWTEPFRGALHQQAARLGLDLAARHLQAQEFDDAIARFQAVLDADDLSEDAHRGLMRAFLGQGRRDLALRQYERCRDILAGELSTIPSAETDALADEIRHGTPALRAQAIDELVLQGDAAMRRRAWDEAAATYRTAIERLRAAAPDDRREAGYWLKLALAVRSNGSAADVAECARRAARLAERASAHDLLVRAIVLFQDATDATPRDHAGHREAAELIESALVRLPHQALAERAQLLAAGARPLAAATRPGSERHVTGRRSLAGTRDPSIEARLREAVDLARQSGNSGVLAYALSRLRVFITSPETLDERLRITQELLAVSARARDPVKDYEARLFRHEDLLESGDVDGARLEVRAMRRIGDEADAGGILAVAFSLQATHETADGALAAARTSLRQSRELESRYGSTSNTETRVGSQLLALRWHEGRIAEMEPAFRRAVDLAPAMPTARAALAFIYVATSQPERAVAELAPLTRQPLDAIPRDFGWWFTMIFMSQVAIATGPDGLLRDLYGAILPFRARNAATAGAVSFGSAELTLAQLAARLEQGDAAEQHFEAALAFNIRTRQHTWTAYTRHHYAAMLVARGRADDAARASELRRVARADAHEIGLPALTLPP